jgi:hypothetical protein
MSGSPASTRAIAACWLLVLASKADMQKRGQASPDDGDALALTFAQPVGAGCRRRRACRGCGVA